MPEDRAGDVSRMEQAKEVTANNFVRNSFLEFFLFRPIVKVVELIDFLEDFLVLGIYFQFLGPIGFNLSEFGALEASTFQVCNTIEDSDSDARIALGVGLQFGETRNFK